MNRDTICAIGGSDAAQFDGRGWIAYVEDFEIIAASVGGYVEPLAIECQVACKARRVGNTDFNWNQNRGERLLN